MFHILQPCGQQLDDHINSNKPISRISALLSKPIYSLSRSLLSGKIWRRLTLFGFLLEPPVIGYQFKVIC